MTAHLFRSPRGAIRRTASTMIAVVLVGGVMAAGAQSALAYDPTAAKNYADTWALSFNTPTYPQLGNDCTNFVSQALRAGGYPVQSGDKNSYHSWYENTNNYPIIGYTYDYSLSWSGAENLLNQLYVYNPGGSPTAYWSPGTNGSRATSLGSVGDVIFYDWGLGEGISHASIQVAYGTDALGWTGDLVDEHTSNRKHVFWSLRDYNGNYATTWVTVEHVAATN